MRRARPHRFGDLILLRMIVATRAVLIGEFEYGVARAGGPFERLRAAAAHERPSSMVGYRLRRRGNI
jgi:hypothetical protein